MKRPDTEATNVQVPVLIENMYLINAQLNRIVKGIQSMAQRRKLTVRMTTSFEELVAWCRTAELRAAIVLCYSKADAQILVRKFWEAELHPVFVNMQLYNSGYPYSCVIQDYGQSCYRLVKEFSACGLTRFAYLGNNPDSHTDLLRRQGLRRAATEDGLSYDVYDNNADLTHCIDAFISHIADYDAVICVNDIVALLLMQRLGPIDKPRIAGFGGMTIGEKMDGFTTVAVDNFNLGQHAVELCVMLAKQGDVSNLTMMVSSPIVLGPKRKKTAPSPHTDTVSNDGRIDFYNDAAVVRVMGLENLLLNCDDVDRCILSALLEGERYEAIEENQYISLSTVKYRVNKMVRNAGVNDRNELLELVRSFGWVFD